MAATVLGSGMEFLDGSVVNIALPALQRGLAATGAQVQWVVEAYALFLASLLLVGGAMGDRFGQRRIFTAGIVVFAAASAWCGIAPSIEHLIAARALQGVGGALLVPNSLALISAHFPPQRRGRAIGIWSAFAAIMMAVGPLVGGWMVEHSSWRMVFFINLPLAALTIAIVLLKVPDLPRSKTAEPFDWPGAVLAVAGLSAVTYSLIEWNQGSIYEHLALVLRLAKSFRGTSGAGERFWSGLGHQQRCLAGGRSSGAGCLRSDLLSCLRSAARCAARTQAGCRQRASVCRREQDEARRHRDR